MNEEKELRYEWMKTVYELLNALNPNTSDDVHEEDDDDDDDESTEEENNDAASARILGVVQSMLFIQRKLLEEEINSGGKQDAILRMTNLTVDQAIEQCESLSKLHESTFNNPMERAILTNDIRVAILTFRVLEEERVCVQDKSSGDVGDRMEEQVPRPPIPGNI